MESSWRLNVWELGQTQLGISIIAKLRTPFAGIEYIFFFNDTATTEIYTVFPSPLGFETFGWQTSTVPYVIAPQWPGFFDVFPDSP